MSSHLSFLDAILENPDADEPRLRYADWLDRSCDPRGEFIRVQCRLAWPEEFDPCLAELELRERELLGEFEQAWAAPLAGMLDAWSFQRGFVSEIIVSGRKYVEHGERVCGLTPVQEVHLHDVGDWLAGVAASPALERVRFLDLSDNRLGDIGVRLLAKSAHLKGVRGMNLSATAAGTAGVRALAQSPHLGNLQELYLSSNSIDDEGALALAESPYLDRLKMLFVGFNCIGAAGAAVLRRRFGARVRL
jgi:uncharacterized protein (TIGR02996 family)